MSSSISEEAVRKFLELGWPNWKIARELKTSATTVQRVRTTINTGPNPVLRDDSATDTGRYTRGRPANPAVLLAIALTVAAVVVAGIVWDRFLRPPSPAPQYTMCVRISATGYGNGFAAGSGGTCPPRWTTIILTPSR